MRSKSRRFSAMQVDEMWSRCWTQRVTPDKGVAILTVDATGAGLLAAAAALAEECAASPAAA